MFQSWVVSMYLDCPTGMGFHCPNSSEIAAFEAAIAAGDITWSVLKKREHTIGISHEWTQACVSAQC
eukprot:m.258592 g.258592  ORF g.258592 m.258592 type:complete len:67 (+) comp15970_c0_seq5:2214-2414(+)